MTQQQISFAEDRFAIKKAAPFFEAAYLPKGILLITKYDQKGAVPSTVNPIERAVPATIFMAE